MVASRHPCAQHRRRSQGPLEYPPRSEHRLHEEVVRARRYELPLTLLMIDVDGFKAFNADSAISAKAPRHDVIGGLPHEPGTVPRDWESMWLDFVLEADALDDATRHRAAAHEFLPR